MVESKGWNWNIVKEEFEEVWKNPSIESFYLVNRWKGQNKKDFLDLGCGLGRHSILFGKNGFNVYAFDISENAIERTRKWAEEEKLEFNYYIGDMLELPYKDESIDVIYSRNVISHTDTEGVKKIINQINRVLRKNGECYLTLCSKETWGFKQTDWPMIDENTKLRMEEGPEYKVPHFYADYDLIKELFKDFKIEFINHIEDFYEDKGNLFSSYHYHILVQK